MPMENTLENTGNTIFLMIPGYYEKFYFTPGDDGYKVFDTKYARIGTLICWDQWYPEAARITSLMGAEILFYPTAIGWATFSTGGGEHPAIPGLANHPAEGMPLPTECLWLLSTGQVGKKI